MMLLLLPCRGRWTLGVQPSSRRCCSGAAAKGHVPFAGSKCSAAAEPRSSGRRAGGSQGLCTRFFGVKGKAAAGKTWGFAPGPSQASRLIPAHSSPAREPALAGTRREELPESFHSVRRAGQKPAGGFTPPQPELCCVATDRSPCRLWKSFGLGGRCSASSSCNARNTPTFFLRQILSLTAISPNKDINLNRSGSAARDWADELV